MAAPEPGEVWWCDGAALAFEARFKRRPVLVVAVGDDRVVVLPLSHRRHHGQEPEVRHAGGVSYLTGGAREVGTTALLQSLGRWDGFDDWERDRARAQADAERWRTALRRLWPFGRRD